jgi:acyl-CoA thioesterase
LKLIEELEESSVLSAHEAELSLNPFANLIGIKIDRLANNYCRLSLVLDEKCLNYYGGVHGGVLATLADNCMGMALRGAGIQPITVELTVNYLRQPEIDDLLMAEGLIIHRGNTIVLAECAIKSRDLQIVARGKGVFLNRGIRVNGKDNSSS